MSIDEYIKENDLPAVKPLGEMKNFKYYIESELNSDEDTGVPIVIQESKSSGAFTVCNADQVASLMKYFL